VNAPVDTKPRAQPGHDELLEHEYDGIREYDNPLPVWWKRIFWVSFVFSLGYFAWYHLLPRGVSVADSYATEMREVREAAAKASLAAPVNEESLSQLMADETGMSEAKALFGLRCAPCHGDRAQGVIGPNLTDAAWIHGQGKLTDIFAVIDGGVQDKGMPAWGRQLAPADVRKLAAFVGTQRGKAVPGKPPEGVVAVQ
jgi:cytochrome c oxidase cbb3-type subunit 3